MSSMARVFRVPCFPRNYPMSLFGDELPSLPWKDAVRLVRKVSPKRTTLPILKYAKATCTGSYATLEATDLDIGIQVRADCTYTPGTYILDVERMAAGLPFAKCISEYPVEDFPALPFVPEQADYLGASWVPAMCEALFATSVDQTRLSLNGVVIQKEGVTATDGHRMVHRAMETGVEDSGFIVPRGTVAMVAGIKTPVDRVIVSHRVLTNMIWFAYPWGCLVSKLTEGPYPNWRQLIVRNFLWEIAFPRATWLEWIKQCPDLKSPDPKKPLFSQLRLVRESGRLRVSFFHGTVGEVEIEERDSEGLDFKIAWNPKYLAETITHVPGPVVTIAGNTPLQVTFLNPGTGNYDILMPLRCWDA